MHTYMKRGGDNRWAVGFELPAKEGMRNWRPIRDFDNEVEAAAYTSFLNGGEAMWAEWRDLPRYAFKTDVAEASLDFLEGKK